MTFQIGDICIIQNCKVNQFYEGRECEIIGELAWRDKSYCYLILIDCKRGRATHDQLRIRPDYGLVDRAAFIHAKALIQSIKQKVSAK